MSGKIQPLGKTSSIPSPAEFEQGKRDNGNDTNLAQFPSDASSPTKEFDLFAEGRKLLSIAVPTVALQFSIFFIYPMTASSLGRTLGTEDLAGFSLASLTGNITCLSIIMGVLSASDTLQPRAFGIGDYREVGLLVVRGIVACVVVLIPPVMLLIFYTEVTLKSLGQDPIATSLASNWVKVYLLGVPSVILFRALQRFLACQSVVMPIMFAAIIGCFVIHPLLLKTLVPAFDFIGSGVAVVTTQTLQAGMITIYLYFFKPHKAQTWPGISLRVIFESLKFRKVLSYLRLSAGGIFSFSEWWYWEVMCFTAGKFGLVPFCAHSVGYQLVPTLFMIPLGLSVGLSVRIGNVLAHDVKNAQRIAIWTMTFAAVIAAILSCLVYLLRDWIIALFTNDDDVIEGCLEIWPIVSIYVFILFILGINGGIMRALGLQLRMALAILIVLWCCALPTVYFFAVLKGGELHALWTINCVAYSVLNITLMIMYVRADWRSISAGIRTKSKRSILEGTVPDEETYLLNEGRRQERIVDLYE